jgi:hypothetical protein
VLFPGVLLNPAELHTWSQVCLKEPWQGLLLLASRLLMQEGGVVKITLNRLPVQFCQPQGLPRAGDFWALYFSDRCPRHVDYSVFFLKSPPFVPPIPPPNTSFFLTLAGEQRKPFVVGVVGMGHGPFTL